MKERLERESSLWVEQAKEDVSRKLISFIETFGKSIEEISEDLGIPVNRLEAIINKGDISMNEFAKMLIVSGNALQIVPLQKTPFKNFEEMRDRNGINALHRRNAPMSGMPITPSPQRKVNRDEFGRFSRANREDIPSRGIYDMSDDELREAEQEAMRFAEQEANRNMAEQRSSHNKEQDESSYMSQDEYDSIVNSLKGLNRHELVSLLVNIKKDKEIDLAMSSNEDIVKFLTNILSEAFIKKNHSRQEENSERYNQVMDKFNIPNIQRRSRFHQ